VSDLDIRRNVMCCEIDSYSDKCRDYACGGKTRMFFVGECLVCVMVMRDIEASANVYVAELKILLEGMVNFRLGKSDGNCLYWWWLDFGCLALILSISEIEIHERDLVG